MRHHPRIEQRTIGARQVARAMMSESGAGKTTEQKLWRKQRNMLFFFKNKLSAQHLIIILCSFEPPNPTMLTKSRGLGAKDYII